MRSKVCPLLCTKRIDDALSRIWRWSGDHRWLLIGDGTNTPAWMSVLWHTTFFGGGPRLYAIRRSFALRLRSQADVQRLFRPVRTWVSLGVRCCRRSEVARATI